MKQQNQKKDNKPATKKNKFLYTFHAKDSCASLVDLKVTLPIIDFSAIFETL